METSASRPQPLALVVEDGRPAAEALSRLLKGMGLRTKALSTGEAALAWMAENAEPDLILVDLMLPSVSGAELLLKLRSELATKDVPIVVLASAGNVEESALRRGSQQYLVKPVGAERLARVVREQLAEQTKRRLVGEAISESLSGLLSTRRAQARVDGTTGRTLRVHVPLEELLGLVRARLGGLRGEEEPDDTQESGLPPDEDDVVEALEVDAPSIDDLRRRLPALGARITGDSLELDVSVPVARRAHAR